MFWHSLANDMDYGIGGNRTYRPLLITHITLLVMCFYNKQIDNSINLLSLNAIENFHNSFTPLSNYTIISRTLTLSSNSHNSLLSLFSQIFNAIVRTSDDQIDENCNV
jgi:hypothetical protein